MKSQNLDAQAGFTLIEVLITITILSTMTVMISNTIKSALQSKSKIQDEIDTVSRIRDTLRIIQGDVHLAFHYRDLEKEIDDLIKKAVQRQQQQPPQQPPPGGAAGAPPPAPYQPLQEEMREAPRENPETFWIGAEDKLDFATLNNGRTMKDTRQADFLEVGYSLKDCRSLSEEGKTSKCVWRRSAPIVDDDPLQGGSEVVLLENVSEFKFRYFGKGKQDWVKDWRSDKGGDGATKGNFPQATEVSLTVEKQLPTGKTKKYSFQLIIPLHFPNNSEEEKSNAPGTLGQPGGGSPNDQQMPPNQ